MKGDISRETYKSDRHYRSVRMQQGRVQLDSDWNEQAEITAMRIETEALDLIGGCGAPMGNDGFRAVADAAGLTADETARPGNASPPGLSGQGDFLITAGRFYSDGVLNSNESIVNYLGQDELPTPFVPEDSGIYLAYLDSWTRHITALEDPSIREVALGGPDTTTRLKTTPQVKLVRVGDLGDDINCATALDEWNEITTPPSGKLTARAEPDAASDDPCIVAPGAGYRSLENHLYRVEVHDGGSRGTATFKWSRDNGSVVVSWLSIDDTTLTVGSDAVGMFAAGDWIELTDETHDLDGVPGTMVRVTKVAGNLIEIDDTTATGSIAIADFPRTPIIRRWNNTEGLLQPTNADWIDLEDGVQIRIADGTYRTGDYWTIPARTVTADVDWPTNNVGTPIAQSPCGVEHLYCRLAVMSFDGEEWTEVSDCRPLFPPVTELTNLFFLGGDGQEIAPDTSDLSQLLTLPELLRVGVSNGEHPVSGARVRFAIVLGNGELNGSSATEIVPTDPDGVAECSWSLDSTTDVQAVEATLLKPDDTETHLTVRFSASLSKADRVAYQPGDCDRLAGARTVQEALDILCALSNEGCAIPIKPGPNWRETVELLIKAQDRIHLCFHPGDYDLERPLVISNKTSVVIGGAGIGTRFLGKGIETLLRFECCAGLTLHDFYASSGGPGDSLPFRSDMNGVVSAVDCGQVSMERLTVQSTPGAVKGATCITVRNGVDPKNECGYENSTRIRACDLLVGHYQTGMLVVNGHRVSVEDNALQAVGRPSVAVLIERLKSDPKVRATLAKSMFRIRSVTPVRSTTPSRGGNLAFGNEGGRAIIDAAAGRNLSGIREVAGLNLAAGSRINVDPDKEFAHTSTTVITVRAGSFDIEAVTPVPLASMWGPLFQKEISKRVNTEAELGAELKRVMEDLLVGKIEPGLARPFNEWLENSVEALPPVALQGIVVGGTTAPDVRIRGNSIDAVRQAIHVGLSHREKGPSGEYDRAGVVTVEDNTVTLYLSSEMAGARHGVFAGNTESLMIGGNYINILRDSGSTRLRTEGIRVFGHLGPRMIARGNHIEGGTIGVRVEPLSTLKTKQWLVADTLALGAQPVVQAPDDVQRVNNIG